jgi:hypothetical protein
LSQLGMCFQKWSLDEKVQLALERIIRLRNASYA